MKSFAVLAVVGVLWGTLPGQGQTLTAEQKKATVAWLQSLQKDNGGFATGKEGKEASMQATVAALRALKAFDGAPKDMEMARKFVQSCYDDKLGGFAATPGAKVDVKTTAYGLMASAEVQLPPEKYHVQPVILLCSGVKKFEDICLAAAAYEAVKSKCELAKEWVVIIFERQNPDGTFGKGPTQARDTAVAVTAMLRLGGPVEKRDHVVKTLQAAQLPDGGWGTGSDGADLATTYHVLRALRMLEAQPNTQAIRGFVAKCRQEDGSYSMRPGEQGSLTGTYFAGSVLGWVKDGK
jgi:prenyltransferase beta subunit